MNKSPGSEVAALQLAANPNPLPPSSRTTTISWNTGDGTTGQIWVSRKGGEEALFAVGASGTQEATWIDAGVIYEFSLYAGLTRSKLLGRLAVSRPIESAVDKVAPRSSTAASTQACFLTLKQCFEFDLNGFCIFPSFVSPQIVQKMNVVVDEALNGAKPFKFEFVTRDLIFLDFISDPRVLEICNSWIDPYFRFDHAWGVQVCPGQTQTADLHAGPYQEQSFFQYHWHQGRPTCSCLVFALFLKPQNGSEGGLCIVPGSHKSNLGLSGEDVYEHFIGRDNLSVPWIMQPKVQAGDLLVFTEATMHGTQFWTNVSDMRRSLYFKYCYGGMGWPLADGAEITQLRSTARNELEKRVLRPAYVAAPVAPGEFRFRSSTLLSE